MSALAAVALPLLAGPALWAVGARRARRQVGGAAAAALAATLLLAVVAAVDASTWALEWGAGLRLTLSAVGVAGPVAVLVAAVGATVVAYASVHEDDPGLARLLGLLVAFVGVMQLLVLAADLLTLLIAWELSAALSWALIGSNWANGGDVSRAAHAFNVTRAGSLGLVLAAGAAFAGSGSLEYTALDGLDAGLLAVVAGGLLVAAASKSAQVPFSPWLYSAMAGPTPVSALLHSATMVAAGAYALVRLGEPLSAVGWFGPTVVAVGLTTAVAGGVLALTESHGKRILAASTSAQYGLMFVAVGVGASAAAAAHLVAHGLFKSLLFLAVGVGIHATGTADVRSWRLRRRLPRVAAAAGIGSLALAAVPPLGAAWTKEQITAAALAAGPFVGGLALFAGLLSAAYAARLYVLSFGGPPRTGAAPPAGRVPTVEIGAVAVLAAGSVALGALWLPGGRGVVEALTGTRVAHGAAWEFVVSLALVATGLVWGRALATDTERSAGGLPAWMRRVTADWYRIPTASRRLVADPALALAAGLARFDDVVIDAPARSLATIGVRAANVLPRFDDAVVDGAVRGAVRLGRALSRLLGWWVERGVDGVVAALAAATGRIGDLSRLGDDRGVDRTVEGIARSVGVAGRRSRALQSGLAHRYYVIAVVGLAALFVAAAAGR